MVVARAFYGFGMEEVFGEQQLRDRRNELLLRYHPDKGKWRKVDVVVSGYVDVIGDVDVDLDVVVHVDVKVFVNRHVAVDVAVDVAVYL